MKKNEIIKLFMAEGLENTAKELEDIFVEKFSIKAARGTFIFCIGVLLGMFIMYFIKIRYLQKCKLYLLKIKT